MVSESVVSTLIAYQQGTPPSELIKRQACRQLLQEIRQLLPPGQVPDAEAIRVALEQVLPNSQVVRVLMRQLTPPPEAAASQHVNVSGANNIVITGARDMCVQMSRAHEYRPDQPSAPTKQTDDHVDLVIVTATPAELRPVLNLFGGRDSWSRFHIDKFVHYKAHLTIDTYSLSVIACSLWKYGGTATATAVLRLKPLAPALIAMTGICAGWESKEIHFGDVIVAERAFHIREGKQTAQGFQPETTTYQPPPWLVSWLQDFADDYEWTSAISTPRPQSLRYQALWALCRLAQQHDFPSTAVDWQTLEEAQINWYQVYRELQSSQLITQNRTLTQKAQDLLDELRQRNYGRLEPVPDPERPRAHYGTFASSDSVISIENPFPELAQRMRSVRAIEMEVASLFAAAAEIQVPVLAVKGVSDYATPDKDDVFHAYAAEASARWLEAFIYRYIPQLPLGTRTKS